MKGTDVRNGKRGILMGPVSMQEQRQALVLEVACGGQGGWATMGRSTDSGARSLAPSMRQ